MRRRVVQHALNEAALRNVGGNTVITIVPQVCFRPGAIFCVFRLYEEALHPAEARLDPCITDF